MELSSGSFSIEVKEFKSANMLFKQLHVKLSPEFVLKVSVIDLLDNVFEGACEEDFISTYFISVGIGSFYHLIYYSS